MSNARQLKFVVIAKKNGATSVTMMYDHLRHQSCGGVHVMSAQTERRGFANPAPARDPYGHVRRGTLSREHD